MLMGSEAEGEEDGMRVLICVGQRERKRETH